MIEALLVVLVVLLAVVVGAGRRVGPGAARVRARGRVPARPDDRRTKGPGLVLLMPAIDRMVRVSLRTVTLNVPPQDVITRDNVTARVDAVVYFRVVDPNAAVVAGRELPQGDLADRPDDAALACSARPTSTRCCPSARSSTRSCRRSSTSRPSRGASRSPTVEIKDVGIPPAMQHAMARQARGRARAAREGDQRRGRVPGRRAAGRGRRRDLPEPDDDAAALPADAERDRRQPELDGRVPAADRPRQAAAGRDRRRRGARAGRAAARQRDARRSLDASREAAEASAQR